jgi:murein DD-endopeptidase MepM/ murein hydrolase activator NlpD
MRRWQQLSLCCTLVLATSCATVDKQINEHEWLRKTRDQSVKTAGIVLDTTSKSAKRMQDYLTRKDLLKTFTDASEHSEAAVLDVLRKAGVGTSKSVAPPGTKATTTSAPVKAGTQPPPKTPTSQQPSTVPTQYVGTLRWPVDAGIISSEFGKRHGRMHKGMDIAGDVGEPINAIAGGQVIYAGSGMRGYGNVVILRHDKNLTSLYAHNSELNVHVGDEVKQGMQVALLGNTGRSTGPHVHFEIRDGDTPLDPRARLPQTKLASVLSGFDDDDEILLAYAD